MDLYDILPGFGTMLVILCSISLIPYVVFVAMGVGKIEPSNLMESNVTADGFGNLLQVPYTHTHTHTYARTHARTHKHVYALTPFDKRGGGYCACVCARVFICVHVRVYVNPCVYSCALANSSSDGPWAACVCVCMCV